MFNIAKQLVCQKYIFKIHSSRLRKSRWKLVLPIEEARNNDELISLADSQVLRWIDELNGIVDADERAKSIKAEIKALRKEPNSLQNRRTIRSLYSQLDEIQYKPDYMCLIIDKEKDYYRASKGFSINGVRYKRLLGTNGGIKNSTIVFVSERLHGEIDRRINNGRNLIIEMVTAKLEAYKALTCSASTPVSMPKGVLVVKDCETEFLSDVVYVSDECQGEPLMEERKAQKISINASDGFGLMLPSLAERWSKELGLNYATCGVNVRFSFTKGMVFAFDFIDFAAKVANGNYTVKDAWGNDADIRNVELILTTSMVKLWDSYKSCDDFMRKSLENKYTFGVTKTCPRELENERNLNYQFIQSYRLSEDDIDELIAPTVNEFRDVLTGDRRKTVLFFKGAGITEENVLSGDNDFVKALMIDERMLNDPFVCNTAYRLIKNRINEAKVGVVKVHGNFSIASGDPFALCQSIFGLDVTGILREGEIYNRYWCDCGADTLACFRAPMTTHANIRKVKVNRSDSAAYWYRYMDCCTVFNAWDTSMIALNGMDFDGDLVMLTDNAVLLRRHEPMPALMCAQRKAAKVIPTEEDFIRSNIDSFGNDIGQVTNRITSMFEIRTKFERDSREYKELSYRIKCGQLYQQNAIDKAKGIICKPMPKAWYDRHTVNKTEDGEEKSLYRAIVADKKPYFMRYIYPSLMSEYNTFVKNTDRNALREFGMTVAELKNAPSESLTDEQRDFLDYYNYRIPVGTSDCVMNTICRRFEEQFDGCNARSNGSPEFDYRILRSDAEYSISQYNAVKRLYEEYNKQLRAFSARASYERIDKDDARAETSVLHDEFIKECTLVCPNKDSLCNIVLDLCYRKNSTKAFAWSMCGDEIIDNLLNKNNRTVSFPVLCNDGELEYGGNRFTMKSIKCEVAE